MSKFLDPYLGPGATDEIWAHPRTERPEMLRNVAKGLDHCHCGEPIIPFVKHVCKESPVRRSAD